MQVVIAFCFVVSIFALLLLPMLFHQICRRTESRIRENTTLPFHQRHFGNTEVEGTSTLSPSNIVQIPIEAPGLNQIESVSNPRVSDNPIESAESCGDQHISWVLSVPPPPFNKFDFDRFQVYKNHRTK